MLKALRICGQARHQLICLVATCAVLLTTSVAAIDWPEFPVPKDSQVTIVTDDMDFNGLRMRAWEVRHEKGNAAILNFYRTQWKSPGSGGKPGFVESEAGDWNILSRVEKDYMLTVQTQKNASSEGYALLGITTLPAVMQKKSEPPELGIGFPKLSDSLVINDVHALDLGKKSRTLLIQNTRSVNDNYHYYRRHFLKQGWAEVGTPPPLKDGKVLMLARGSDELNMTIERTDNKTNIVAVLVQGAR